MTGLAHDLSISPGCRTDQARHETADAERGFPCYVLVCTSVGCEPHVLFPWSPACMRPSLPNNVHREGMAGSGQEGLCSAGSHLFAKHETTHKKLWKGRYKCSRCCKTSRSGSRWCHYMTAHMHTSLGACVHAYTEGNCNVYMVRGWRSASFLPIPARIYTQCLNVVCPVVREAS